MAGHDEVRLAVPAAPEFLRLARLAATGLASRMGFTFDEVEDLRLAIDELCFTLIGSKGRPGSVDLRYSVLPEGLAVEGVGHFDGDGPSPALSDLSRQILDALVDRHEVSGDGSAPRFFFLKRRRHGT